MSEATDAIKDLQEDQREYGSTITFVKAGTDEVRNPNTYEIVTPASPDIEYPTKMFIDGVATDKIIAKLTDNQQSYSLYISGYFAELIDQEDWKILYGGDEYTIIFIDKFILQDTLVSYDILVKK